ncbi:hypothetical protein [Pedobacter insulae]|uniref:Outer membrane protein beta-barrel domain-containing protein n=1 Tax=Pedobacter insulae TaxID=414048 RepID=A0A1I2ZB17_9SPHI|nr:hypothetical protein [Pedobacter insulae]SFH34880.1 hypothetical protein SAMN04489864_109112 [Pedobacter insulae]
MKKKLLSLIIFSFAFVSMAWSQMADTTKVKKDMSLQVMVGTQGIGVNFRYVLTPKIGLRFGGSYAQASANDLLKIDGFKTTNKASGKFNTVQALAEFMPLKGIRLVGGVAYLASAEASIYLTPKDTQKFEDMTFTPAEIGSLDVTADWGTIAPYFGFGFGKGIPKKRFNVNFDLGAYYLSAPSVTIVGTKRLSENDPNEAIIQENMKGYRFMPVAQLNFNFKF